MRNCLVIDDFLTHKTDEDLSFADFIVQCSEFIATSTPKNIDIEHFWSTQFGERAAKLNIKLVKIEENTCFITFTFYNYE